jgi:hypothetical protein
VIRAGFNILDTGAEMLKLNLIKFFIAGMFLTVFFFSGITKQSSANPNLSDTHLVKLPKFIGLTKDQAISSLEKLALKYQVIRVYDETFTAGIVTDQEPEPETVVNQEVVVKLIVSLGPPNFTDLPLTANIYPYLKRMCLGGQAVYTRYGIHGTNRPTSIGRRASHGCIRLYNKDILKLWPQVKVGDYVITQD